MVSQHERDGPARLRPGLNGERSGRALSRSHYALSRTIVIAYRSRTGRFSLPFPRFNPITSSPSARALKAKPTGPPGRRNCRSEG
jgi:hypothetical protein